jgi:hypothetical protein
LPSQQYEKLPFQVGNIFALIGKEGSVEVGKKD